MEVGGLNIQNKAATEKVRSEDIRDVCGWSPFEGKGFPGRARGTIAKGQSTLDGFVLAS